MNPRYVLRASAAAALLAGWTTCARAAFQVPLTNPQTTAMGGSAAFSLGDSSAMFVNPAGVSGLIRSEAYFSYNQMFAGLSGVGTIGQGMLTTGFPTRLGTFSLGFADFMADSLLEERTFGLTFARRFGIFDAGFTAKYLYHRYLIGGDSAAGTDPAFQNGASRGALGIDGGINARLGRWVTLSMAVRNINQPDVGVSMPDRVPREYQAGLAYGYQPWELRLLADFLYRSEPTDLSQQRCVPSIGLEKRYQALRLRMGVTPTQFSAGLGVDWSDFGFDYAFVLTPGLAGNNFGTHTVGLRYRFGAVGDRS